ncbi:hypothetical protein [Xenorhabdus sp. KJ12.1]|uniref:hypothetical protein n=1 Tax=Xenorhabdus sp. KJ12.1 TaxID=1851571 RepID=UPI000C062648|nr:hypothetical protein [Xenorhabdus sp. KJ12.1]PHM72268.1 hypothetical protein Xekj_00546 [Xenorhabdus sp. KJ12.1]
MCITWRCPIYRYETGDIEVSRCFLFGLLDGYLVDRKNAGWRARFYATLLEPFDEKPSPNIVICGGKVPVLSKRGVRYMNALVHQYGDMLTDIGMQDEYGTLIPPENDKGISLQ